MSDNIMKIISSDVYDHIRSKCCNGIFVIDNLSDLVYENVYENIVLNVRRNANINIVKRCVNDNEMNRAYDNVSI